MKSKRSFIPFVLAALLAQSCGDYLDKTIMTNADEKFTFQTYNHATTVAYSMYANLPQGLSAVYGGTGAALFASACDEAEFAIQNHNVQKYNLGTWRPTDMPENPFNTYYEAIRKAYNFVDNADDINYDSVKDNPAMPGTYEKQLKDVNYLKNEVMLLRAYFMLELMKRYGGVPVIDHKMSIDEDYRSIQRSSLEDCLDEVLHWCDVTAGELPAKHENEFLGRCTKGTALAIKSEALLWAASDLWNDASWAGGYPHPEYVALPAGDRIKRWRDAADAAKAVIDISAEAGYALDTYDNLFGPRNYMSPEIILAKRDGASNSFEKVSYPISFNQVTGGNCPSQNLVDKFEVLSGGKAIPFDWSNLDMAANPYANRDPRLAKSILTNNETFKGRAVECWTGGRDGEGVRNATATGYYMKKYVNPDLNLDNGQTSPHTWIIIRLGEIYLNYIEALNECAPGDPDIKAYFNAIRTRAGMPGMPDGLSQDEVRELIRHERAVELCFEGQRFWDLRRWMDRDALKEPLRAVRITKEGDSFTYAPYELEKRVFEDKMFFYPFPQQELNKMSVWEQNPLW